MPSFNRRAVLKSAAWVAPLVFTGRAFAAPSAADNRLLIVFLRGAYDAANIVVPTGSQFYHDARPTIGLGKPDPANPAAPDPLDADWSLHPALRESILPLWHAGQIAFVPFAGTDDLSRSHFETQDTIELGLPSGAARDYRSGFLGRLAGVLGSSAPIAFTQNLPLCFRGGPLVANFALGQVGGRSPLDEREAGLVEAMYRGWHLGGVDLGKSVTTGFSVRDQVSRSLRQGPGKADRGATPPAGFELGTRRIARLMRDQFNLAFVDVGGWDTHVFQGGAQGYLASRIGELGRALAGFADEIGADGWSGTTVIVVSEFGRTFRENGDKGTDHGHGSIYWVLGGGVRGGRIAGQQVRLAPETLNQGRDLPVLTDYRALIGEVLARQFGLSTAQLERVFPGIRPAALGLL